MIMYQYFGNMFFTCLIGNKGLVNMVDMIFPTKIIFYKDAR